MILATIVKHRIQIGLRHAWRAASVARSASATDKGPWALRKIGGWAGAVRASGIGTARLLPASLSALAIVAAAAFVLAVVGGVA